jgi:hypothetical protein
MGSDTLPCHFMRLPTELRLMVFRYLFPKVMPSHKSHDVKVAILKTNRQIHQEASSVLYSESRFQAVIRLNAIELQGKFWSREPVVQNQDNDYSVGTMLCRSSATLIRNLDVDIGIGTKRSRSKGLEGRGITQEEYHLYAFRDTVRKFAEYFQVDERSSGSPKILKNLKVSPSLATDFGWKSDEAVIALFFVLEPFQMLRAGCALLEAPVSIYRYYIPASIKVIGNVPTRKAYLKLQKHWLKAITDPTRSQKRAPELTVEAGYRKIEAFAQLIHVQDMTITRSWTSTVFQNLERPLHLACVANENKDSEMLGTIHEAIKLRWVNAHRQRRDSLQAVADSINTMFEKKDDVKNEDEEHDLDDDGNPTPRELYPDAFEFEDIKPLKQPYTSNQSQLWLELRTEDTAPKREDPGVITKMGLLKVHIRKDKQEWVRLKTPAMIRQLQAEKEAATQK